MSFWARNHNGDHRRTGRTVLMLTRLAALVLFVIVLDAALALPGLARQLPISAVPAQTPAQATPEVPQDPMGRTTPYDTVANFIRANERGDLAQAAEYLDGRQTPEHKQELARTLMRAMDLGLQVDRSLLSRQPEGNLADGLRQNRELVGVIGIGGASLEIFLDRVQRGNNPPLWLFSTETLLNLPDFAEKALETPWFERFLPTWLVEKRLFGIALFRYITFPLFLLLVLVSTWLASWALVRLYGRSFRTAIQRNVVLQESRLTGPIRLLLFGSLTSLAAGFGITLMTRIFWGQLASVLIIIAVTWLLLRVIDFSSQSLAEYLRHTQTQHRIAAVQLFRGAAKALSLIVAFLAVLKVQGFDLTTVIAGLGIGGLALAFAAQKTIENLFGTVMLVTDQPVRVGDFCRVGDTLGTIENIGLRSTRIRTLDRTVVSVPNGQVASMTLENFAPRDKIWFRHTIGLRYETTADQIRYVLATIRAMLYEHPKVESASARIRFVRFGGSSLDLEIFAYVFAPDIAVFLEIQEDLLLRIMDIVETSGTGIAFPSQTTYFAKDSGLDEEKGKAAIAQVEQWREQQNFPFPNYSPETIAEIQNSLEYPPPESSVRKEK